MAIRPDNEYVNVLPASPQYPYGEAKDEVTPGVSGDGTPFDEKWINDLWGFQAAILNEAKIAPNGNPDNVLRSDYLNAIKSIIVTSQNLEGVINGFQSFRLNNTVLQFEPGIAAGQNLLTKKKELLELTQVLSKNLALRWRPGNNEGARLSNVLEINQTWHFFLIKNDSTGQIDIAASTLLDGSDLPDGWKTYVRIMSITTNSEGNIIEYTQTGNRIILKKRLSIYRQNIV